MVGPFGAQPLDKRVRRDAELIADPTLEGASRRADGIGGFGDADVAVYWWSGRIPDVRYSSASRSL